MVQLIAALLFLGAVLIVEIICVRRERRFSRPEFRVGMIAVRRLIDDVEHGRIVR